jgi:signal transduction histidine kinase
MADHVTPLRPRHSLAAQLMLSLAGLALLSVLIVGLPAIWLVGSQLQSQAWAQVQQGQQASRALYDAQQNELAGLATLTAQRPTLVALLRAGDAEALLAYLDTLRRGADLDLIAVCDAAGQPVAQVSPANAALLPPLCALPMGAQVLTTQPSGVLPQVWLAAAQRLAVEGVAPGTVVVARWLDEAHVQQMRAQTGLDHTLLVAGRPVVSSVNGDAAAARQVETPGEDGRVAFTWDGEPFYAAQFALLAQAAGPPVQAETALSVAGMTAAQQRLLRVLLASMALATALGLLLAAALARRISRPLADLTGAATAMRGGDLSRPIATATGVREVALVAEALEAARADLQRTLAELRQEKALTEHFLASVSHEFRTPLTAVAASVELLIDQANALSPAELHELLDTLHLGVLNLHKLVDNLLESASIEAGRFRVHLRPADLGDIIAEAAATMQPLLDRHGQRLVVKLPADMPMVMADPRRVVQVLVNLLSNASHAQRGLAESEITISAAREGGVVRVRVADQGPGIAPEQRAELLQGRRFFALSTDASSGAPTGFGLGLSVVKAIVESHHGQWGMDDGPGGGAVVWFTLPSDFGSHRSIRTGDFQSLGLTR